MPGFWAFLRFFAWEPTPDVPPVVSRSEGIPKDALEQLLKPGETRLMDALNHWKELIERGNGRIIGVLKVINNAGKVINIVI